MPWPSQAPFPTHPYRRSPLDVRSRFAVVASWIGFGVSVGLGLVPLWFVFFPLPRNPNATFELGDDTRVVFSLVIWPLVSWYGVRPLVGGLAACFLPIYHAVIWKPERYQEVYDKPLPHSIKRP
jgi:hypothetical protein